MIRKQTIIIMNNVDITNVIFGFIDKNVEVLSKDRSTLTDYLDRMGAE